MNRAEAEKKIRDLAAEIEKVVLEYSPHDHYLTISMNAEEGYMTFNNEYWEHEENKIDAHFIKKGGEWV